MNEYEERIKYYSTRAMKYRTKRIYRTFMIESGAYYRINPRLDFKIF
jgi:hypothetical protein